MSQKQQYVVLKENMSGNFVDIEAGPMSFDEAQGFVEENLCEYRDNGYEIDWIEA